MDTEGTVTLNHIDKQRFAKQTAAKKNTTRKDRIPLVIVSGMKMIYNSTTFANFQRKKNKPKNLKQINLWLKLVALKTKLDSWHSAGSSDIPPQVYGNA